MKKRVEIIVSGKVQGVGFRYYARLEAQENNLAGWAKNDQNGNVSLVAEGEEQDLMKFINWCQSGSRYAQVDNIKIEWKNYIGDLKEFVIIH